MSPSCILHLCSRRPSFCLIRVADGAMLAHEPAPGSFLCGLSGGFISPRGWDTYLSLTMFMVCFDWVFTVIRRLGLHHLSSLQACWYMYALVAPRRVMSAVLFFFLALRFRLARPRRGSRLVTEGSAPPLGSDNSRTKTIEIRRKIGDFRSCSVRLDGLRFLASSWCKNGLNEVDDASPGGS